MTTTIQRYTQIDQFVIDQYKNIICFIKNDSIVEFEKMFNTILTQEQLETSNIVSINTNINLEKVSIKNVVEENSDTILNKIIPQLLQQNNYKHTFIVVNFNKVNLSKEMFNEYIKPLDGSLPRYLIVIPLHGLF